MGSGSVTAVAVPLIIVSVLVSYQNVTTSAPRTNNILIDFLVYPETNQIIVERGVTTNIPLKVQAPNDAEKTLQLRLTSGGAQLNAELSKMILVLSKVDVEQDKVTDLGGGRGTRDAGTLTLSPQAAMSPGEYTFGIEAEQRIDREQADAVGSTTIVYVTVK